MKYAAAIAADQMEKSAIEPMTMALLGLAAAPTVTRWLNKLTGHDAKKNVLAAQKKQQAQQPGMQAPPAPPMMAGPAPMARGMLSSARGLHGYRGFPPSMRLG